MCTWVPYARKLPVVFIKPFWGSMLVGEGLEDLGYGDSVRGLEGSGFGV